MQGRQGSVPGSGVGGWKRVKLKASEVTLSDHVIKSVSVNELEKYFYHWSLGLRIRLLILHFLPSTHDTDTPNSL